MLDATTGGASDAAGFSSSGFSAWQQVRLIALPATAADFRFFGMGKAFRDKPKSQCRVVKSY
jgi:hypothetical protein